MLTTPAVLQQTEMVGFGIGQVRQLLGADLLSADFVISCTLSSGASIGASGSAMQLTLVSKGAKVTAQDGSESWYRTTDGRCEPGYYSPYGYQHQWNQQIRDGYRNRNCSGGRKRNL